jgi:8-oxo-dGTP pyrophosphatase MutT (NUDIX family)
MPEKRVSALIIDGKKLLLVHRIKNGSEYYVLPGGSVEVDEDNISALIREVKEETNLDVEIGKELWQIKNSFERRVQHIFLVTEYHGNLEIGSPEKERQSENNKYLLEWHDIEFIKNVTFYPCEIIRNIINEFA